MQRIYLPSPLLGNQEIIVDDQAIHHQITTVLRARLGLEIAFFDGISAVDFVYTLTSINKKHLIFGLHETIQKPTGTKHVSVYQALLNKQDKIEWILQKGSEVGYRAFHFFRCERSQAFHLTASKMTRFERIVTEAIEQSGRNFLPSITFHETIPESSGESQKIIFHTQNTQSSLSTTAFSDSIEVWIGPEGGFSPKEILVFSQRGFHILSLGDAVLRAETASIGVGFYLSV